MKISSLKLLAAKFSLAAVTAGTLLTAGAAQAQAQWGSGVQYSAPTYRADGYAQRVITQREFDRRQREWRREREARERREREEFLRRQAWLRSHWGYSGYR